MLTWGIVLKFILQPKHLLIALIIAVTTFFAVKIYRDGVNAGYGSGQRDQLETDKKGMQQDRDSFQQKLDTAQQHIDSANAIVMRATEALDAANQRLSAVQIKRQDDQKAVNAINDSALFGDITGKLGIRDRTDTTPEFRPSELRQVDLVLTDYDALKAENAALADKVDALSSKVDGLSASLTAVQQQRDAAVDFSNQMLEHYTAAYNAAQKKPNLFVKVITLGLYHGRHLTLPDPVSLKKNVVAEMPKNSNR